MDGHWDKYLTKTMDGHWDKYRSPVLYNTIYNIWVKTHRTNEVLLSWIQSNTDLLLLVNILWIVLVKLHNYTFHLIAWFHLVS
jgi:hypothetical protein